MTLDEKLALLDAADAWDAYAAGKEQMVAWERKIGRERAPHGQTPGERQAIEARATATVLRGRVEHEIEEAARNAASVGLI